ncbi:DoxX family protein [Croceicoccus sediminis]|uniref:DoxX family protein n=1 Tax=Croceicoccus sediminis TaxID=2571150 RepID=UPI001478F522|nr:DoxX family protein [Croceicoccus sediminis]
MSNAQTGSAPPRSESRKRMVARLVLAALYAYAGYAHIATPETFLKITPDWVPMAETVIFWTGIAELAGAIALAQPFSRPLRQAAGIGLALYALCVWPANINHMMMDLASPDGGWGLAYHLPRMALQPVLIWLALWTGGVIDWPRRKR